MSAAQNLAESLTVCEICFDNYSPENYPKMLACHHCFCLSCLSTIARNAGDKITCPTCRKVTSVVGRGVADLSNNIYILKVIDTLNSVSGATLNHNVSPFNGCDLHNGSTQELFCESCSLALCRTCALSHNVTHILHRIEIIARYERAGVQNLGSELSRSLSNVILFSKRVQSSLRTLEDEKLHVLDDVRNSFETLTQLLRQREQEVLFDVDRLFNQKRSNLISSRDATRQYADHVQQVLALIEACTQTMNYGDVLGMVQVIKRLTKSVPDINDIFATEALDGDVTSASADITTKSTVGTSVVASIVDNMRTNTVRDDHSLPSFSKTIKYNPIIMELATEIIRSIGVVYDNSGKMSHIIQKSWLTKIYQRIRTSTLFVNISDYIVKRFQEETTKVGHMIAPITPIFSSIWLVTKAFAMSIYRNVTLLLQAREISTILHKSFVRIDRLNGQIDRLCYKILALPFALHSYQYIPAFLTVGWISVNRFGRLLNDISFTYYHKFYPLISKYFPTNIFPRAIQLNRGHILIPSRCPNVTNTVASVTESSVNVGEERYDAETRDMNFELD